VSNSICVSKYAHATLTSEMGCKRKWPFLDWYWVFNIPIWYKHLICFEIYTPWQYKKNWKLIRSFKISHNAMNIIVLKCVMPQNKMQLFAQVKEGNHIINVTNNQHKQKNSSTWMTIDHQMNRNHITTFIYKGPLNSSQIYHWSKLPSIITLHN